MICDIIEITLPHDFSGKRLDKALTDLLSDLTRTRIQALIKEGHCESLGQKITSGSRIIQGGEVITLSIPEALSPDPTPEKMDLDIVFEDDFLLVLNKPAGLVVHPAPGHYTGTLVHGLLYHCKESLSGIGGVKRPGIVHRLDKETSGLMVVAKTDIAHQGLMSQFQDRSLSRTYLAFVWGWAKPPRGTIEGNIGRSPHNRQKMALLRSTGKPAVTHYHTQDVYQEGIASLVECVLETGRTHQIRVHLSSIGHSVVNDPLYGSTPGKAQRLFYPLPLGEDRQALHAKSLRFIHPVTQEELYFETDLPLDLKNLQSLLQGLLGEA